MEHFYFFMFSLLYAVYVFANFARHMMDVYTSNHQGITAVGAIAFLLIALAAPYVFMNGSQLG